MFLQNILFVTKYNFTLGRYLTKLPICCWTVFVDAMDNKFFNWSSKSRAHELNSSKSRALLILLGRNFFAFRNFWKLLKKRHKSRRENCNIVSVHNWHFGKFDWKTQLWAVNFCFSGLLHFKQIAILDSTRLNFRKLLDKCSVTKILGALDRIQSKLAIALRIRTETEFYGQCPRIRTRFFASLTTKDAARSES